FLDRFDVTDPAAPVALASINIPGQIVHYEHERGLLVTVEDVREVLGSFASYHACTAGYPEATWEVDSAALRANGYDYEHTRGTCVRWHRRLNSLSLEGESARRVSQLELRTVEADGVVRSTGSIAVSNSRIFYQAQARSVETGDFTAEIVALGYGSDGHLTALGRVPSNTSYYGYSALVARGDRAFVPSYGVMEVVESPDDAPPVVTEHELRGWACDASSLEVVGDQAFCAGQEFGVQRIALD
ncbi:MAG TPA: hypothetical protein VGK73_08355, partial [Polyangiaceae bacterium]